MADATCSIKGCDDPAATAGMCNKHYIRVRRHGDPHYVGRIYRAAPSCSVKACTGIPGEHGYCEKHLEAWRIYGDPLGPSPEQDMLPGEVWLAIPGFAGYYEASSLGRIRSLSRTARSGKKLRGRVLKGGGSPYLNVSLVVNTERTRRYVHVLICEAFHGPCPDGMEVRHLDDDKLNNAASNLVWGTRSENMQDRRTNGIMYQLNRTHCKNKHEWTPENTIFVYRPDGSVRQRICRGCREIRNEGRRERRRLAREARAA